MKRIFRVVDSQGVFHRVEAHSMVSDGPRVVFWGDGALSEVASFLGAVAAVEELPPTSPVEPLTSVGVAYGEAIAVDLPPTVAIGTLNITGVTPESAASIAAQIQGLMDRRQSVERG